MLDYNIIKKGALPFGGSWKELVPHIHKFVASRTPISEWARMRFYDMTAGSGAMSISFAAHGMRVFINDYSERTAVAARGVFCSKEFTARQVKAALAGKVGSGMSNAVRLLLAEYMPVGAVDVFAKLFYLESPVAKYLAIRWLLRMKVFRYSVKIPTQDLGMLLCDPNWGRVAKMVMEPYGYLCSILEGIEAARKAVCWNQPSIYTADARDLLGDLELDERSILFLDPPTRGNKEFQQSNRLIDSVIANSVNTVEENDLSSFEFWKSFFAPLDKHRGCGARGFSWAEGSNKFTEEEGIGHLSKKFTEVERVATYFPDIDSGGLTYIV